MAADTGLVARMMHGVHVVTGDAHGVLHGELSAVLEGVLWQRYRIHFIRDLLDQVPSPWQDLAGSLVSGRSSITNCPPGRSGRLTPGSSAS